MASDTEDVPRMDWSEMSRIEVVGLVVVPMCLAYATLFYLLGFSMPHSVILGVGTFLAMIGLMGWTLKQFTEVVKS